MERYPRTRRAGLPLRAAKLISEDLGVGIQSVVQAKILEAYFEEREKRATALLDEATLTLEQNGKLGADFLQRIRELIEK